MQRTFMSLTIAGLVALAAAPAAAGTATICNQTAGPVSIALAYPAPGSWQVEGWWVVQPGGCTEQIERGDQGPFRLYVERANGTPALADDGQSGGYFCVAYREFKDRHSDHLTPDRKAVSCRPANMTARKFTRINSRPEARDVITIRADGTLSAPGGQQQGAEQPPAPPAARPPRPPEAEPQQPATAPATAPARAPVRRPAPSDGGRTAAPAPGGGTPTPDACRRYPNLC